MPESNWKILLREMYEDEDYVAYPYSVGEDHRLVSRTRLSPDEVIVARSVLEENDWVATDRFSLDTGDGKLSDVKFSLSKEGFEFAHEREVTQRQHGLNRAITILTVVLAFGTLVQIVLDVYSLDGVDQSRGTLVTVAAFLLLGGFLVWVHRNDGGGL